MRYSPPVADSGVPTQPTFAGSETPPAGGRTSGMHVGRYRLRSRLGAGAMGEVWVATDPQLERDVAIKLVHPLLARQPDISARMVREARAMAKVSHRSVIAIHDAGEADGHLFLAMELVRGRTLGALLRERSADDLRDWRRWLAMALDAGRGLAAAHAAGVLHRDFKPDNVMVDEHGRVCVGDFGLATLGAIAPPADAAARGASDLLDPSLTMAGALLGTPGYMSLEQLRGEPIDARADQFSFCATAYEAVYGEAPFAIASEDLANIVMLEQALAANAIRPAPADTRVPDELRKILLRGLASSPAARWPDLDALLAALGHVLSPRSVKSPRAIVAAIAGAALLVVAISMWLVTRAGPAPQAVSLGSIPLHAVLAMSPDGRLAIGTDQVEIRDLAKSNAPSIATGLGSAGWVQGLQFDSNDVLRWSMQSTPAVWRWSISQRGAPTSEPAQTPGTWLASMAGGDLVVRLGQPSSTLALVRGDRTLRAWALDPGWNDQVAVSPSRRRFAYATGDRFGGRIVVASVAGDETWRSPQVSDLSAFAWLDDHTLLYSSADVPAIDAFDVDGERPPYVVHRLPSGFAGRIAVGANRIVYLLIEPKTRVRLMGRNPPNVRDLDPSVAAGELGWLADGSYVTWHRTSYDLERVAPDGKHTRLGTSLAAEPANATFAGGLALIAERGVGGRQLVAVDLASGKIAWSAAPGQSIAARCARDLVAPCFVAQRDHEAAERYEIVPLDPTSGKTIGAPVYRGPLEDFAISADGHHILVADGGATLTELDDGGARISTSSLHDVLRVRSVAYDPSGGILIAGSGTIGNYVVGHLDGTTFATYDVAGGEILSLVRPSPVSDQLLAQGRTLTASLWDVEHR